MERYGRATLTTVTPRRAKRVETQRIDNDLERAVKPATKNTRRVQGERVFRSRMMQVFKVLVGDRSEDMRIT